MSNAESLTTIKVGDKEIELADDVYRIIHDHYKNGETLDRLADELGLNGWDEAYQLVSAVPQWVLWFTQAQFEEKLKLERKAHPPARRHTRRRKSEASEAKQSEAKEAQPESTPAPSVEKHAQDGGDAHNDHGGEQRPNGG